MSRTRRVLAVLCAVALGALCAAAPVCGNTTPASFKFFLTQKAVTEIATVANPLLEQAIAEAQVPDVHYSALGIHLDLTNISLSRFDFGTEVESYTEPVSLTVSTTGLATVVYMNWSYTDGPAIDWSGWAEDDVSSMSLSITIGFGSDAQGHLTIELTNAQCDIGALDIHLHGSGGQFFNDIAKIATPLIRDVACKSIVGALQTSVSTALNKFVASIPLTRAIDDNVEMYYGLVQSSAVRGLAGAHYSNAVFGGSKTAYTLTTFNDNQLSSYSSIDVNGYFRAPADGAYSFTLAYTQRAQVDVNGQSAGELEPHNPGMCWPEHFSHSTGSMTLQEGQFYPIRIRQQAGCGGGHMSLSVCVSGTCNPVSPMELSSEPDIEFPVTVWDGAVEVSVAASALSIKNPQPAPFPHQLLPDDWDSNYMINVFLGDYLFNSVGFALAVTNDLHVQINNSDIPPTSPFTLNTSSFEGLLPDLYAKYPNDLMTLDITLTPAALPNLTVSAADGLGGALPFVLDVNVLPGGGAAPVKVLTFLVTMQVAGDVTYDATHNTIGGNLASLSVALVLEWSLVNVTDVAQLQGLLNFVITSIGLPQINERLAQGFPIPTLEGVSVTGGDIKYFDGFVGLFADFSYKAPSHAHKCGTRLPPVRASAVPIVVRG